MPKIAIAFGVALIIVGIIGFLPHQAKTALIPAIPGVLLLVFGLVAMNPAARKHAMHAAAAIALLGALASLGRLIAAASQMNALGLSMNIAMFVLCDAFVALCVMSFVKARRERLAV